MNVSTELPLVAAARSAGFRSVEGLVTRSGCQKRVVLWIDAVGGFLVCAADVVRLGQAVPGADVEVPLLADLSRQHATIRRDSEGYVLEAARDAKVNGRPVERAAALATGALIELGAGVLLRFVQPHALSATARLDLVSRHQTRPTTSGIVLWSEACILGPSSRAHVVCRGWQREVVLMRQGEAISCLAPGTIVVDGKTVSGNCPLNWRSRVSGADFSFSLEEL